MVKERYKTPSEIIENNPKISKIWDCRQIGYLFYCKLISGKKLPRGCLVSEREVLEIFNRYILLNDNS